jgi:hypothetical protein
MNRTKNIFEHIYKTRGFGGDGSVSGPGSDLSATEVLRHELPILFDQFQIRKLIDAPCGDYNWMRLISKHLVSYVGIDIVPALIDSNNFHYADEKTQFWCSDICEDVLQKADAIMCRDCLVHLANEKALHALQNFKASGSKYLIATTFPQRDNEDVRTGFWRPTNLAIAPFNLGEPIVIVNEGYQGQSGRFADKSLGLWQLN